MCKMYQSGIPMHVNGDTGFGIGIRGKYKHEKRGKPHPYFEDCLMNYNRTENFAYSHNIGIDLNFIRPKYITFFSSSSQIVPIIVDISVTRVDQGNLNLKVYSKDD